MRALKIAGAVVGAIIVFVALITLVGLPSGFMTSALQSRVERDTGYRLTIAGSTRITLWPTLKMTLNELTVSDPKDRDLPDRMSVESVQAEMSLSSAWSGHPQLSKIVFTRPVVHVPLLRERLPEPNPASGLPISSAVSDTMISHLSIKDGTIILSNPRDRMESRIHAINAGAVIGTDRKIDISGTARAGDQPLNFAVAATAAAPPVEHANIPFELTLDAPGLLQAQLTAKGEARLNGAVVMMNGISGKLGDESFNGWASADVASKPLIKVDLDFQRLDLGAATSARSTDSGSQPWSSAPVRLNGLNYFDAQVRISAAELNLGDAHFAPASIDSRLAGGVLKAAIPNLGAYGGQVSGELIIDASSGIPNYAMHSDLVGVRALPLLEGLADFDKLDGKLQAKVALRSTGNSQQLIMSNLAGTVFANFQDGAIRGLNVARMMRSLSSNMLSGWQESGDQTTDLTQLSASFGVDKGQATTTDLNLIGPLVKMTGAGTVDLGSKTLAFRVEPRLVMTTEGQGRRSDPVGLGVPVVIDGPWSEPRIYPEIAGILDDPDAAYAKLREMGKGLFGANGGLGDLLGGLDNAPGHAGGGNGTSGSSGSKPLGDRLGETLGNLIEQGFGGNRGIPAPSGPDAPRPTSPPRNEPASPQQQDSQPMNDLLRQLFSR